MSKINLVRYGAQQSTQIGEAMYTQSEAIIQQKLLFAKKEAAALLSISIRKLEYLIASGELQTRRIGKRVLVTRGALTAFARTDHF